MTVLVTDRGFAPFTPPKDPSTILELGPDSDPDDLDLPDPRIVTVRIAFHSFSDGRGFTLARQLRRMGYTGRLHAVGHVIADQYAMARRSGFDAVEITRDLAKRQPAQHWRSRSDWKAESYQSRLSARDWSTP